MKNIEGMIMDHNCEELLEIVWKARENNETTDISQINPGMHDIDIEKTAQECLKYGVLQIKDNWLILTPDGEIAARSLVRRHRLAEVLMLNIFALPKETSEAAACSFEHILTPEVTDHICTFLGHPRSCPDGKAIPPGSCCEKQIHKICPIIMPLSELRSGDLARIVYIESSAYSRLGKLATYGVMPNAKIKLLQRRPSFVIRCENTDLALDDEIVRSIFVRHLPPDESN